MLEIINEKINEREKIKILQNLQEVCSQCTNCELSKTRSNVVFSDGNPMAKIMLIGEAPGQNEDIRGVPFVGRAGQLLDKFLEEAGILRKKDLYICNTVKCRPPENRIPTQAEKAACKVYLDSQISIVRPLVILLCGMTAVNSMIETKLAISKIRGQWFNGPFDSKMMPIFHPSYLLRNHSNEEGSPRYFMQKDLEKVVQYIKTC